MAFYIELDFLGEVWEQGENESLGMSLSGIARKAADKWEEWKLK